MGMKVNDNLDPYGTAPIRTRQTDNDEADPKPHAFTPKRPTTVAKERVVDDRRIGQGKPTVADLPDSHFTPGTLQRDLDNDGYTKTRTRPTGQGPGFGARQAGAGTRGAGKRGGPFSTSG